MTPDEQEAYIKKHFSRDCRVNLVDCHKYPPKKPIRRRRRRAVPSPKPVVENVGRKKYSCYICFEKFVTEVELYWHKDVHKDEEDEEEETKNKLDENDCIYQVVDESSSDSDESSSNQESRTRGAPIQESSVSLEAIPTSSNSSEKPLIADSEEAGAKQSQEKPEVRRQYNDYKCITCNVFFANQLDIKAHIHAQYTCKYFCKRCSRQFNTKGGFIVHVLQHGMDNSLKLAYKCDKCTSSFDDCYQLKRHYVIVHNVFSDKKESDKELPEKIAKIAESEPTPSADPSNPITGNIPIFDCDICFDVFASQKALRRHKAIHEGMKRTRKESKLDLSPICIDDDDVQFVTQDAWPAPHYRIPKDSVPGTPQVAPATKPPRFIPIKPREVASTSNSGISTTTTATASTVPFNKTEVTSQITQMLSGSSTLHPVRNVKPLGVIRQRLIKKMNSSKSQAAKKAVPKVATTSAPILLNHTIPSITNAPQSSMLSLPPGLDPSKTYYVLLPSKDSPQIAPIVTQVPPMVSLASTPLTSTSIVTQGSPITSLSSSSAPNVVTEWPQATAYSSSTEVIPASVVPKPSTITKLSQKTAAPSTSTLLPIISNVESCQEVEGNTSAVKGKGIVMPVITSFGTVTDDISNKKDRTDPTSHYESEYAKFLERGGGDLRNQRISPMPNHHVKIAPKPDFNIQLAMNKTIQSLISEDDKKEKNTTVDEKSLDSGTESYKKILPKPDFNMQVAISKNLQGLEENDKRKKNITVDEESTDSGTEFTDLTSNVPLDPAAGASTSGSTDESGQNWNMPKIFVKKMSDLF